MSETNNKVANGFRIPVWNGLLDHFGRMKDGIWLFLFCLDKTTKEYTGEDGRRLGKVCGTQPLRDADIAKSIEGCSAKVVRKWRLRLVKEGYLIQKRTPYGHILEVAKSKKWTESDGSSELPKRASHPEKGITQPGRENCPTGPRELPESANTKKTLQDCTRKDRKKPMLSLSGNPWQKIGLYHLPEACANFVAFVEKTSPRPGEKLRAWMNRIVNGWKAQILARCSEGVHRGVSFKNRGGRRQCRRSSQGGSGIGSGKLFSRGCRLKQNADTEDCATFDPANEKQVAAVIKAAGLKVRRVASPAQLEHLRTIRALPNAA